MITFIRRIFSGVSVAGLAYIALLSAIVTAPAQAASFDCAKARPGVEQAICLDPALSRDDVVMGQLYRNIVEKSSDADVIRQSQRDWLRLVRNKCQNVDCLTQAYARRIGDLRQGRPTALDSTLSAFSSTAKYVGGQVSYSPPSATTKQFADWLQKAQLLEVALNMAKSAAPNLPMPHVVAMQCKPNGYAYFVSTTNIVVLCYQLVEELNGFHLQRTLEPGGSVEEETTRMAMALKFVILHEIGHAVLHRSPQGSLGKEETEADNFAGVVLLLNQNTNDKVRNAVWGMWSLTQLFSPKAVNTWEDYGDEHELPQQRLANFACLALGAAPGIGEWLSNSTVLPKRRAARCPKEWSRTSIGLKTLVTTAR